MMYACTGSKLKRSVWQNDKKEAKKLYPGTFSMIFSTMKYVKKPFLSIKGISEERMVWSAIRELTEARYGGEWNERPLDDRK